MFTRCLLSFIRRDSGAVTVDMTVLMAAIVGLGLATTAVVNSGTADLSQYVDDQLTDMVDDPTSLQMLRANHDDSWRAELQERVAGFNDNRLTRGYNNLYARAQTGNANQRANRIDRLGVFEAEMIARGLPIPDGNTRHADLHAAWLATYS